MILQNKQNHIYKRTFPNMIQCIGSIDGKCVVCSGNLGVMNRPFASLDKIFFRTLTNELYLRNVVEK